MCTINSTNNHAVIVSSSRYWFNYRHAINALSIYQMIKANGIPDENIVLFLADDLPSNARNKFKNGMYANGVDPKHTLYDSSIQVDYRGEDVTVQNLVKAMLGRQGEPTGIRSSRQQSNDAVKRKQLQTDENSNVLIYLTGHGGDQFFKFQDIEEITSEEIANILEEMHRRKRYKQVLVVADTCQAFTLGDHITAPNVMVIGSSLRGESSYAHHSDQQLGLSVIERYTHGFMQFVKKKGGIQNQAGNLSIRKAMVEPYPFATQRAHIGFREDLMQRDVDTIPLSDFFANNQLEPNSKICLLQQHQQEETAKQSAMRWPLKRPAQLQSVILLERHLPGESLPNTGSDLGEGEPVDQVPVYNPSDGAFLSLVVALLAFLAFLSRPKSVEVKVVVS